MELGPQLSKNKLYDVVRDFKLYSQDIAFLGPRVFTITKIVS